MTDRLWSHVRNKFDEKNIYNIEYFAGRCLANAFYSGGLTYPTVAVGAEHSTMTTWGKEGETKATE